MCWHNANLPSLNPASIRHQVLETYKLLRPVPAALETGKALAVFIHSGVTVLKTGQLEAVRPAGSLDFWVCG